jgi:hypothetical protein
MNQKQQHLTALADEMEIAENFYQGAFTPRERKLVADALREYAARCTPVVSDEVVVTTNRDGDCVAVTRQDNEGRILSVLWEAPTPEQAAAIRKQHDEVEASIAAMKEQKG